jgi:hypothetical protein
MKERATSTFCGNEGRTEQGRRQDVGRGSLVQIAVTNAVTFQAAQLDGGEGFVLNKLKFNTAWLLRPRLG